MICIMNDTYCGTFIDFNLLSWILYSTQLHIPLSFHSTLPFSNFSSDSEVALQNLCRGINVRNLFLSKFASIEVMDNDQDIMDLAFEISQCYWKDMRPKWVVHCPFDRSSPYDCLDLLNDQALSDYWKTFTHVQRVRQHIRQEILATSMNEQSQFLFTISKRISESQQDLLDLQEESKKEVMSIHSSSSIIKKELETIQAHMVPVQEFLEMIQHLTFSSTQMMTDLKNANASLFYVATLLHSIATYLVIYIINRILVLWYSKMKPQTVKIVAISFMIDVLILEALFTEYCFLWRVLTLFATTPASFIIMLTKEWSSTNKSVSDEKYLLLIQSKLDRIKESYKHLKQNRDTTKEDGHSKAKDM